MEEHAALKADLDEVDRLGSGGFEGNGEQVGDMYASLVKKEESVLNLIRRIDDTNREQAMRDSDKIYPLLTAFIQGGYSFTRRVIHYASVGSTREIAGLITSADGLVYCGAILIVLSVVSVLLT